MKERGLRSPWDPEWSRLGASHSYTQEDGRPPYGSTVRRDRLSSSPVGDRPVERGGREALERPDPQRPGRHRGGGGGGRPGSRGGRRGHLRVVLGGRSASGQR